MDRALLINQLEQIKSEQNAIEIYLLAQPDFDDGKLSVTFFKARLQENIPEEVIGLFFPSIKKRLIDKDYEVKKYDPSLLPDREVIWEQSSDDVPFFVLVSKLLSQEMDIGWYKNDLLPYKDIWAYWIKIYTHDRSFYIIKKVTPSKIIRTGGKLALVFESEIFRKLSDDVMTMDGSFDVIYCDKTLIFENKQNFERALLYSQVKQTVAENMIDDIGKTGFIENVDELKDFLKDDQFSINKLNKLRSKPYFKKLTFADCVRIIKNYGVNIPVDENKQQFAITSKAVAKLFVKVLNDDYLTSEMTNYKYSTNSKEDI
jgi:hypothetical protein